MDQLKRRRLIGIAYEQGMLTPGAPSPVVSLEDFFEGNDDPGSIGCNTWHAGPEYFEAPLYAIRARPDVQDVLIEIQEVEEQDESMWPFADRVYILTRADRQDVADWLKFLDPDAIEDGYGSSGKPKAAPALLPGMKVYAAWWD